MKKINVIGMESEKEEVISDLIELGAVQILPYGKKTDGDKEPDDSSESLVMGGQSERIMALDARINEVSLVLDVIKKYSTEKSPLFVTRRAIGRRAFDKIMSQRESIEEDVNELLSMNVKLHKLREEKNRATSDLKALAPWKNYGLPLNVESTEKTVIDIGVLPATVDMNALTERLAKCSENISFHEIHRDRELIYIFVISLKEENEKVLTLLRQHGYAQTQFKGFSGTAVENEKKLTEELALLEEEISKAEDEITARQNLRKNIECLYDQLIIERDKEKAKNNLVRTKRTFGLTGWIPETCTAAVSKVLGKHECYIDFVDPEEGENVPVLMSNSSFVYPFESVTEMYSLPDYRGVDPTKYFSIFYAMFFGIMLSDAGYGLVITLATYIVLKKFDLEGTTYKMIKMFFYCGISTMLWGALFGGWFGDFFQVAARTIFGKEITIPAIWFNPIEDPTKLLIFSIALGVVHIFIGMGIKASMLIKRGQLKDAVFDVFSWYMVIIGAIMWLSAGSVSEVLKNIGIALLAVGALILLFTGGRDKKGIGRIIGGLTSLYDITSYASDILSYSRLLALGLATGVIAQVVNTMGSLAGGGVVGTIVLLFAFVVGHTFNLAINALGAFVHTSRLQYIEFFGKFYEDGGEEFEPLQKNTKYVRITDDSNGGKK